MFSANLEIAIVLSQSNKKQDLDGQCWSPTALSVKSWRKHKDIENPEVAQNYLQEL